MKKLKFTELERMPIFHVEGRKMVFSVYEQILFAALAVVYAIIIVFVTKSTFKIMQKREVEKMVAVYYNRKFVHKAAGELLLFLYLFFSILGSIHS